MWNQVARSLSSLGPAPTVTWLAPISRIELSGKTYLNAISKAGNYLVDGCGFDNETPIRVELENHWQSPVWNLAALVSGVGTSDESNNVFCFSDSVTTGNKYVVSRDPFGKPERDLAEGIENVSLEVRSQGDYFAPSFELGEVAAQFDGSTFSESKLIELVNELVSKHGISGRYGLVVSKPSIESLVLQALVPALTNNSVVLLDGVSPDAPVVAAEKITQVIEL